MSTSEILQESLRVVMLGMGTVLITLYVLSLILDLMERILVKPSTKPELPSVDESIEELEDQEIQNEELVAIITAALSRYLDKPIYTLKVGAIRQLHKKTPNWGVAARVHNINNKL